jgi:hypothetical protein
LIGAFGIFSFEAAAPAKRIRISSNDQHIKTLGAARNHHIHGSDAGIFASTDRCATQRDPVRMPLGL